MLVAGLGTIWGVRLGTYLLARLAGKEEDGRYQELRRRWAPHVNRSFFVFFQAQAAFILVFSLPFAFVAADEGEMTLARVGSAPRSRSASIAGEMTADTQLAVWKGDPGHKGKTCPQRALGLVAPPELLLRVAALGRLGGDRPRSPCGWVAIARARPPARAALQGHGHPGDRGAVAAQPRRRLQRYQEEVSVFVPLPPRRRPASS